MKPYLLSLALVIVLLLLSPGLETGGSARAADLAGDGNDARQETPRRFAQPPVLPASPDGRVALSVEQAVMLALHNNRDLQVRQLTPVIVGRFEEIERGRFDPELFAEIALFEERSSETSRSTGEQFDVSASETAGSAGIRQELPSGTTLEATIEQQRSISNRAPEQQTARVGLSITQALLRGSGSAVNLASVRQAELETLASIHELRGFTEAMLADAEIAYWRYVLAGDEIAIFEESLKLARRQLEETELRIEVGILPEIEVAAARAEVALREQALIDAHSQLEERRLQLLRLINPGGEAHFDLLVVAVSEPDIPPEAITDLAARLSLAEQMRADLEEARLRLRQNRLETVVTRNGVLPRLDLFIALGETGYASTFSESLRNIDGNTHDLSAGIRLSHFLGNRAAEARNLAAYASRRQAAAAIANLRQLIHLQVRLAVNEVERTRQQIEASRATRVFQEQTLDAEKERFDVGSTTALQVAQAQRDLLRTQIAEVEAVVDHRVALVRLAQAEGSLLERRGIRLEERVGRVEW